MAVATPIAGMGLDEARRSLLLQMVELRRYANELEMVAKMIPQMTSEEVWSRVRNYRVLDQNFALTLERIDELEANAVA